MHEFGAEVPKRTKHKLHLRNTNESSDTARQHRLPATAPRLLCRPSSFGRQRYSKLRPTVLPLELETKQNC